MGTVMSKTNEMANQPAQPNAGGALLLAIEHYSPGVPEPSRSMERISSNGIHF
jgi:hypothetical protein